MKKSLYNNIIAKYVVPTLVATTLTLHVASDIALRTYVATDLLEHNHNHKHTHHEHTHEASFLENTIHYIHDFFHTPTGQAVSIGSVLTVLLSYGIHKYEKKYHTKQIHEKDKKISELELELANYRGKKQ